MKETPKQINALVLLLCTGLEPLAEVIMLNDPPLLKCASGNNAASFGFELVHHVEQITDLLVDGGLVHG